MSPVLRALVDADNQRPGPSADDRTRVYAALGVSLGLVPAGAVVAAHAASAAAVTQATAAAAGGTSTVATAIGAASTVGRLALLVKAPLMSVGVGAVLGAALTAYVATSPVARSKAAAARKAVAASVLAAPRAVPQTATAAAVAPAPEATPAERPAAPDVLAAVATPPASARTRSSSVARHQVALALSNNDDAPATAPASDAEAIDGALGAEQALLDPARAALARGDGAAALARLDVHEHRYPAGALSQEREAMTIRALVLTGRRDGALARAASFRARYPDSLLWPMIDATLNPRR